LNGAVVDQGHLNVDALLGQGIGRLTAAGEGRCKYRVPAPAHDFHSAIGRLFCRGRKGRCIFTHDL
jgi:hypothetical protein